MPKLMLETLHRIVQKVNAAPDLGEALITIASSVKAAMDTDVCSIYLTDFDRREHVLRATEGLHASAVGSVVLPMHRGLVGLVSERAEPLNIDDAPDHPRYLCISESGETRYHGFLGVPIIQNRKVLGVIVARQVAPRKFEDEEVTFLFTLAAQLAGAITHARASGELARLEVGVDIADGYLQGQASSSGVAMGKGVVTYCLADLDAVPDRETEDPADDIRALHEALKRVETDLMKIQKQLEGQLPEAEHAIFDALLLMLKGDELKAQTVERIHNGQWVQSALHHTIEEHAAIFDNMDDAYLRERASDIRDLGRRVLMHLQGDRPARMEYAADTVLVGEDVSAVQLTEVPVECLTAVISATGSSSSHVAILARAMGVPAVMGVDELPVGRLEGLEMIVDGYQGRVYISPNQDNREKYRLLELEERELAQDLEQLRGLPAETTDGVRLTLTQNTGLVSDASAFALSEFDGVGLHRTELLFMTRDRFPGEDVQALSYREVLSSFSPRSVTLRTLDVGGDKPLPYFPINEANPFLGWRGVRLSLDHPEIFLVQIRAMLKAAAGLNNLQIMLPMVSTVEEVDEALMLIHRAQDEIQEEGGNFGVPKIGVMIEVPSAVYQIEAIARRVDFLSVGSNDLTQYLLAVDRDNHRVAELYDDLHPAVLNALKLIVAGAKKYDRPVSVCGELAGNPLATLLLLGLNVDSLSMSASSLLKVKWVVRSFSRSRARTLLGAALRMDTAEQVRRLMAESLDEMGLGGLVRPGKK